ncbi:MAG TPA: DUF1475 family protein [Anaerolineales bacterium]|nr:DUF1475 family protein [Anaerolineales bacterium]
MRTAKLISILGIIAMTIALFNGFTAGDFFAEGSKLAAMPWGIVSLVDLYTGFVLFSCWIFYREKSVIVAIAWTVAMMTLGFLAGSLYVFITLLNSEDDWRNFWLGKHA